MLCAPTAAATTAAAACCVSEPRVLREARTMFLPQAEFSRIILINPHRHPPLLFTCAGIPTTSRTDQDDLYEPNNYMNHQTVSRVSALHVLARITSTNLTTNCTACLPQQSGLFFCHNTTTAALRGLAFMQGYELRRLCFCSCLCVLSVRVCTCTCAYHSQRSLGHSGPHFLGISKGTRAVQPLYSTSSSSGTTPANLTYVNVYFVYYSYCIQESLRSPFSTCHPPGISSQPYPEGESCTNFFSLEESKK